jgi:hypothetical protein
MIEEELIGLETAILAKEKGFNERTLYVYKETFAHDIEDHHTGNEYHNEYVPPRPSYYDYFTEHDHEVCKAPTQSLLQRWLREVHNIHCWVSPETYLNFNYHYFMTGGYTHMKDGFPTYEIAMEEALKESLKTLKTIK